MWKLFKADLSYNGILFGVICGIIITAAIVNAVVGGLERFLGQIIFFSIVAIGAIAGNEQARDKMGRLGPSLPVPIIRVVIGGHLLWFCYWISIMLILWLSALIGARGHLGVDFFWYIIAFTGASNSFVAWMGNFFELRFYFLDKFKQVMVMGAAISIACFFAAISLIVARLDTDMDIILRVFMSPAGAVSLLFCSIVSTYLYFALYAHRKSYTE